MYKLRGNFNFTLARRGEGDEKAKLAGWSEGNVRQDLRVELTRNWKLSSWMICSTFRCDIGVIFCAGEYFPNAIRQAMKVPAVKSVPPLGLHGSSTFTTDHSLCSSGRHGKSISIHSFPSCFCRPLPSLSGLYQWTCVQYAYTIYMILQRRAWLQSVICLTWSCYTLKKKIKIQL